MFIMYTEYADAIGSVSPELKAALADLQRQGLTVRLHNAHNCTWHIADGGLYSGYAMSGDELLALQSANKLNIRGITDLVQTDRPKPTSWS
jgi:hypothetical protein